MTDTRCPQCGTPLFYENAVGCCPNCDCDRAGEEADTWPGCRQPNPLSDPNICPNCGAVGRNGDLCQVCHGEDVYPPPGNILDDDDTADWLDDIDEAAIDAALDGDPEDSIMPDLNL